MTAAIRIAETDADIARVFPVMQVLRPQLASPEEFVVRAQRQRRDGWRLAYVEDAGEPVAATGFRVVESLGWGRALYVDDLVAVETHRGKGFARTLMTWLEATARAEGCGQLHLDSGTHRERAHHFYFRQGLSITSFHFARKLD